MSDWEVEFHPFCQAWADRLSQKDSEALLNMPTADQRFDEHQEALKAASKSKGKRGGSR